MNLATQENTGQQRSPVLTTNDALDHEIDLLLSETRSVLRRRVWSETLQRCFVAAIVWFLAVWAIDYLPIWLGASELPQVARFTFLLVGLVWLALTLFHWGWRRANIHTSDEDIALLLEDRNPILADRLATVVSLRSLPPTMNESELYWQSTFYTETSAGLQNELKQINVSDLFDWSMVKRWGKLCGAGLATLIVLGIFWGQWMGIAFAREVLLDSRRWPRQSDIELQSLSPVLDSRLGQLLGTTPALTPIEGQYRVAKGSDVQLVVEAKVGKVTPDVDDTFGVGDQFQLSNYQPRPPRRCMMTYQLGGEESGRQYLTKFGQTEEHNQGYRYDGPPLQRLVEPLRLQVYGDDDRLGPFEIIPVDNLALVTLDLSCEFPNYLRQSGGTKWLPQTIRWVEGLTLPSGTDLEVEFRFNKAVQRFLLLPKAASQTKYDWKGEPSFSVRLPIGRLDDNQTWELWAQDSDQVWTRQPIVFTIGAQADRPPEVQVDLDGIENAVTPDAILPIVSQASDDYGLQAVTARLELPLIFLAESSQSSKAESAENGNADRESFVASEDPAKLEQKLTAAKAEELASDLENQWQSTVDLRQWQQRFQKSATLAVDQQQSIQVQVLATDYYEGEDSAEHQSRSQTIHLEVVSPATLLRLLKRSEVGQRRRLEQIYDELIDQRFYLQRSSTLLKNVVNQGKASTTTESTAVEEASARPLDMAAIFGARARNQNEKSRQELSGVQNAFQKIVQQIVNNRLEAAEYRRRLEINIIDSMQELTGKQMRQTGKQLKELDSVWENLEKARLDDETSDLEFASKKADALLAAASLSNDRCLKLLDQILRDLLKFESDAELYELVREIYDNQKRLMDETGRQQQEQAFEDLFGN